MATPISTIEAVSQVNSRVVACYNTYSSTPTDTERFPGTETLDATLDADGQVVKAFLQNAGDGRRSGFLTSTSLAYGAEVPSHLGQLESVTIAGDLAIPSLPLRVRLDRNSVLPTAAAPGPFVPKYYLAGNQIFHNGTNLLFGTTLAVVTYADYTRSSICQAPSEYTAAVVALAVAMLIVKNGGRSDAGSYYRQLGMGYLVDIARGEMSLPGLPPGPPMPDQGQQQQQVA